MNLQLALIILGIAVVLGIYLYSRWQEKQKKHSKRRDRHRGAGGAVAGSEIAKRDEPSFDPKPVDQINPVDHNADSYVTDESAGEVSGLPNRATEQKSVPVVDDPVVDDLLDADLAGATEPAGDAERRYPDVSSVDDETRIDASLDSVDALQRDHAAADELETEDVPVLDSRVDEVFTTDPDPADVDLRASVIQMQSEFDTLDVPVRSVDGISTKDVDQAIEEDKNEPPVLTDTVSFEEPADSTESLPVVEPIEDHAARLAVDTADRPDHGEDFEQLTVPDLEIRADEAPTIDDLGGRGGGEILEAEADEESDATSVNNGEDHSALRPSLSKFIGSIGPFNKIKQNIQQKLDTVKAERERGLTAQQGTESIFEGVGRESPQFPSQSISQPNRLPDSDDAAGEDADRDGAEKIDTDSGANEPHLTKSAQDRSTEATSPQNRAESASGNSSNGRIQPAEGFDKLSQIDYYVKLSGERDVSRDSVLAIYREGAAGIARNHSIYGLRLPEKVWRDLEQEPEEARFGDLVVTIQLVDHDGLVTENDMTRFSSLIMKLSESTGRGFAFMAPIENAHQQAQAIERFKKQFDSIFVVNIKPLEAEMFEGAVIERCASQIGLTPDSNNFYARYKPVGKQKVCLYSLANMSDTGEFDLENMRAMRTRGVTFFTRPAINRSPGAVFSEMVDAAKAFASRIKGEVIAPGYDDLSSEDIESIRRSIEQVASQMEEYGINPGSEEATRLFG